MVRMRHCVGLAGSLLVLACSSSGSDSGSTGGTTATSRTVAKSAGDGQSATVGAAVAIAPSVIVTDGSGQPVNGAGVTFAVASGGGSVTATTAATSAAGIATVGSWTLGHTSGANTLTATLAGPAATGTSSVTFTATGIAGAAAAMSKQAGDAQQGSAGQNVTVAPSVVFRDAFGNPVSGVAATFAVASGGGSVTGASPASGADGTAAVGSWKLGNTPGANTLTATTLLAGVTGSPATFSATGNVGAPAAMAKVVGDNQAAPAGAAVNVAPTVRVTDAVGNNVSGAGVNFAVTAGAGTVTGGSQTTAADGTAKPTAWTLGASPGTNTLSATSVASGVTGSPIVFTATGGSALSVAPYVGNWTGTWQNATFGSTGTTTLVIAQGGQSTQANITLSGTGTVLGGSGAPAETRTNIPVTPSAFTLQTVSSTFGNVTLNVDSNGGITGSGTQIPNPSISGWSCTGTITTAQIHLTYTVTFSGGGTATGTITLNKG